ncbi:MAG: 3-isopropylmalate dehydratase small subunit [bacterium]|nr:3-isopropylmalate dehydratase small subunit [bacterium]
MKGKVWKFGDNINTDDIIAARYLNTTDEKQLAQHCMETIMPDFSKKVQTGDVIVAGENFGCGSSREHAPVAIKGCGISAVIAKSFARIFLRNAINIGLPVIELSQADEIEEGDEVEIDFENGVIRDITKSISYTFTKYPDFLQEIIKTGGLIEWVKAKYIK